MKKRISVPTAIVLMLLAAVVAVNITVVAVWNVFNKRLSDYTDREEAYSKFSEVMSYVKNYYVGETDEDTMLDGAMKGYIGAIGDRWSTYLTEEEYKELTDTISNSYTGVGISAVYDESLTAMVVAQVYADSPASRSGISVGDLIVAVDGHGISEMGYYAAVDSIRGEEGSTVVLSVCAPDGTNARDVTLERHAVTMDAVSSKKLASGIGYIRIENFDAGVNKSFAEKLDKLLESGVKGVIFDVRFNGGGEAAVMIPMLDKLLPEGPIFSMKDKSGNETLYSSDAAETDIPMAVLTNEYTYSAAEFFAAALQEYDKAVIVGDKTTGKGYAQKPIPLSDGSALYLSTYTYYTPQGRSLADVGVTPDVPAELSEELERSFATLAPENDTQLQTAESEVLRLISEKAASSEGR